MPLRSALAGRLSYEQRRHLRNVAEMVTNRRGQRRPISRDYLFHLTARFTPSFTIESGDARFVLSTADKEISRILFIYGYYDRLLLQDLHRVLSALNGRPFDLAGKLFLDIGANIGSATVEATVNFGAAGAVAFEPDPENFRFLNQNLAANNLLDVVDARTVAVSDFCGRLTFEKSPDNWGDHRVRRGAPLVDGMGESAREVSEVEAVTLDSLVESGELDLDRAGLAWIDVQAHEAEVLEGARHLTASDVPVVLEYWTYGLADAGSLDRLDDAIADAYTHFVDTKADLTDPEAAVQPVSRLGLLRERYPAPDQPTDLVLLRR